MIGKLARIAVALALGLVLAACGGGGSGGGGEGQSQAAGGSTGATGNSPAGSLAGMTLLSAARIQVVGLEGYDPDPIHLQLGYSGDIAELAQRQLFVYVTVPDRAYQLGPWGVDRASGTLKIALQGLIDAPVGKTSGFIEVRVCLDAACTSQLPNSPLSIPFELEMKRGLQLTPAALALTNTFGATPAPTTVAVQPPFNGSWELVADQAGLYNSVLAVTRDGDKLLVTPNALLRPGNYRAEVKVRGDAPDTGTQGFVHTFYKTMTVTFTVSPGAVPYYLSPASGSYDITVGDSVARHGTYTFMPLDGSTYALPTPATYVSQPAAATGNPQATQWLTRGPSSGWDYLVSACAPGPSNCLPAGTYTAIWSFRLTAPTGVTDVNIPVTMTLRP